MIELRHIYKSYGRNQILNDLSLKIGGHETVCMIGEVGGGRSTLLRCIAGLVEPDSGEIIFQGGCRPRIGMIFQQFNLFKHLNVLHNLTLAPKLVWGMSEAEAVQIAMEQLEAVGLSSRSHMFPHELSEGQKQRVAIARSLVMKPQILLLDEPLSALDPIALGEVTDVLRKLRKEMTLVMNTHKLNVVAELADRVVFMEKGHVCEEGTVEQILVAPRKEATKRFLSHMKDLHFTIESSHFDRPELNARIEQYCNRFGLGLQAVRCVQLAVEESLNIISLDKGVRLKLSKVDQQVRMQLELSAENTGVQYLDGDSCPDELSLTILQGMCDVLEERVDGSRRILYMELDQERLLLK